MSGLAQPEKRGPSQPTRGLLGAAGRGGGNAAAGLADRGPAFSSFWSAECHRRGFWGNEILFDCVVAQCDRHPAKVAVADNEGFYRYDELVSETLAVARGLRCHGVDPGDVVMLVLPPVRAFVPLLLATERIGAVMANVLPGLGPNELSRMVDLARPRVVVSASAYGSHRPAETVQAALGALGSPCALVISGASGGHRVAASDGLSVLGYGDLVDQGREASTGLPDPPQADELANLTFTTGSSAEPKGVLHTHNTSLAAVRSTARRQQLGEDDIFHAALPVGHTFGHFYGIRMGLAVGGTIVLQRSWSPKEMARLARRWRITHAAGTPTHLADLAALGTHARQDLASLRVFTCAGAPLNSRLGEEAIQWLPGRLSLAYGMSEAGHVASTGPDDDVARALRSCGRPHPETAIWIDHGEGLAGEQQPGEILIQGPSVFAGYLQAEYSDLQPRRRNGIYQTGDLGFLDGDGFLTLTGRTTQMVIRGGEKIPIGTLEGVLREWPEIDDVVITGVPDARLGERCVAVVEAGEAAQVTLDSLQKFLESRGVTKAFWPEELLVMEKLPRNEVGKWVRSAIRTLASKRLSR